MSLSVFPLFYKRSREGPCISLLVVAGFVLDAIFLLECFSNMTVTDAIVRFLCLCKSVLSFFGDDFVHQVIGITSRCQACSKLFNVLLKHNFRRVCPEEPKRFSFNESFFNACRMAALEDLASCGVKTNKSRY